MAEYIKNPLSGKLRGVTYEDGKIIDVHIRDTDDVVKVFVPVRHGRWIDKPTGRCGQWQAWCSACNKKCGCGGTLETQHKIFCPNCGARMDGGSD